MGERKKIKAGPEQKLGWKLNFMTICELKPEYDWH